MGNDFRVTREKITRLVEELRSWDVGEERATVEDLAKKFGLDTFVVDRVAQSENIRLPHGHTSHGLIFESQEEAENIDAVPDPVDEDAVTEPIEPVVDEDADTGVYRRNPRTGEFERVEE